MNYKELIVFFVTSYGSSWKEELTTIANIAIPGDKLAINTTTACIYVVSQTLEGVLNVRNNTTGNG